jgi:hypothetical protein
MPATGRFAMTGSAIRVACNWDEGSPAGEQREAVAVGSQWPGERE